MDEDLIQLLAHHFTQGQMIALRDVLEAAIFQEEKETSIFVFDVFTEAATRNCKTDVGVLS